jgi:Protein of unknown function (DUF1559)
VREAAARVVCRNQLKQIGLATQNYLDQSGFYPVGTVGGPERPVDDRFSWLVTLLPYVEAENTYKQLDLTSPWNSGRNRMAVDYPVPCFRCPSEINQGKLDEPGLTHYVGVAGVGLDAATLPASDPRAGFFGYDRRITMKDIHDGTSNTMLSVEAASSFGPWAAAGPATVCGLDSQDTPYVGQGRPFGRSHPAYTILFGKPPVVAQMLLGDGSVLSIKNSISATTFEALATIAGNDEVGSDRY